MNAVDLGPLRISFDDDEAGLFISRCTVKQKACLSEFLQKIQNGPVSCRVATIKQPSKGYPGGVVHLVATCGLVLELWFRADENDVASCRDISPGKVSRMDIELWGT